MIRKIRLMSVAILGLVELAAGILLVLVDVVDLTDLTLVMMFIKYF